MEGAIRSYRKALVDAGTIDSCKVALTSALAAIQNKEWYPGPGSEEEVKTALARNIAEHASFGETDPQKLQSRALRKYFLDQWNWLGPTPSLLRAPRRRRKRVPQAG
jgi:hypothetical protein